MNDNENNNKKNTNTLGTRIELIPNKWQRQTISRSFSGFYFSPFHCARSQATVFRSFLSLSPFIRLEFLDYENAKSRIRNERRSEPHRIRYRINAIFINVGSDGIRRRRRGRQRPGAMRINAQTDKIYTLCVRFGFLCFSFTCPPANYIYRETQKARERGETWN